MSWQVFFLSALWGLRLLGCLGISLQCGGVSRRIEWPACDVFFGGLRLQGPDPGRLARAVCASDKSSMDPAGCSGAGVLVCYTEHMSVSPKGKSRPPTWVGSLWFSSQGVCSKRRSQATLPFWIGTCQGPWSKHRVLCGAQQTFSSSFFPPMSDELCSKKVWARYVALTTALWIKAFTNGGWCLGFALNQS